MTAATPTLQLRPYQLEAVSAVSAAWSEGFRRVAVVLPTGTGKTVIFAHMIAEAKLTGVRPLVLVHRDELVKQAAAKISSAAPGISVGVVKAERDEHGPEFDVVVASVQTIGRTARRRQIPADSFGLIIVDECHHAAADTWRAVLEYFGAFPSADHEELVGTGPLVAGFTATLDRSDDRNLADVWQTVAYHRSVMSSIMEGHLVDVRGQMVKLGGLDMSTVKRSRGDYQDGALADALAAADAYGTTADAYLKFARRADGELRRGILFAPTVDSAAEFAREFNEHGITTELVVGTTPAEQRAEIYRRVHEGVTKVIASCMVLTEGFDLPSVECAVIARPTAITALYVQMVGRIMRPSISTGKTDALVLDIVGISEEHRLATLAVLNPNRRKPRDGESLLESEAVEEDEFEQAEQIQASQRRARATKVVDLFAASTSAWLQTYAGTWFIPTRGTLFFLWPTKEDPELFMIGKCDDQKRYGKVTGGEWLLDRRGFPIDRAMAWASQEAETLDPSIARRGASWRVAKAAPSDGQRKILRRYQLGDPATKAEASDLISVLFASKVLDRR